MRVLVSAGEPSGDTHAAGVVRALLRTRPDAEIDGIGGPQMEGAGAHLLERMERLSASGLVEVTGRAAIHVRLLRRLRRRINAGRYDLVLVVDYPGFHLRLARAATRAGLPVLYYIAPQLWAWGRWRIRELQRSVRRLAVILPFEEAFFGARGVPAAFVGHPLLDRPPASRRAARRCLGVEEGTRLLGLFPGSREHEYRHHRELFATVARRLRARVGPLETVVASSPLTQRPSSAETDLATGDPTTVLAAADAVLCKAGTTTLEAALADVPMVIAHRMHPVTFRVARRLVRVPHVGLVNLLAESRLAPEFLQGAAQPDALAEALATLLDEGGSAAHRQRAGFATVRARLGTPGAGRRVAELALRMAA
jgi:lipid-A-disaccharide synthase